jgi:hypothetical protein
MWNKLLIWLGIREDVLPPKEKMIVIDEAVVVTPEMYDRGIRHVSRGDVRLDIERKKPKQMKSRPRKKK